MHLLGQPNTFLANAQAADPAKGERYTELVVHTLLPPLRRIAEIMPMTMHLADLPGLEALNQIFSGAGLDWPWTLKPF